MTDLLCTAAPMHKMLDAAAVANADYVRHAGIQFDTV